MAKEIDAMTMEEVMAATMTETRRVMQLHEEVRRVHEENHQLRLRICKRRAPVPPPTATPVAPAAAPGAEGAQPVAPKKKLAPPTPDSETPRGGSEMVSVFNEYLQVNHAAFPEPTIEKVEGLVKMTLKLTFNGQTFEATATCTNRKICKQVASEKLFEKIVPDVDIHASLQPVRAKIEEKRSRLKLVRAEKERNKRGEKRPWEGAANNAKRANLGGMGGGMGGMGRGRGGGVMGYNAPSTTNNWQQPQQPQQPQLNQQLGLSTAFGATAGTSAWGGQATAAANTNGWGMMQQQQQEPVQQQAKTQTAEEQANILEEARKKGWAWDGSQWVPANQPPTQPAAAQKFAVLPGATGFY